MKRVLTLYTHFLHLGPLGDFIWEPLSSGLCSVIIWTSSPLNQLNHALLTCHHRVVEVLSRGVQIDHLDRPVQALGVLNHSGAVGALKHKRKLKLKPKP